MSATEEAIGEKFACLHPRHRLLACEEAAVPYFIISAPALLQEKQPIPPIDEFVLRLVKQGLTTPSEIGKFLGVEKIVAETTVGRLWQSDLIDFPVDHGSRTLRLTPQGEQALHELAELKPTEREIWFAFDRLQWKPVPIAPSTLLRPQDVKDSAALMVRPRSGRRPALGDLNASEIDRAIKESMKNVVIDAEILVIKRVDRAEQRYLPCHLLIYESDDRREHIVEVIVDGRRREDLRAAVDGLGGAEWLELTFADPAELDPAGQAHLDAVITSSRLAVTSLDDVRHARIVAASDSDAEPTTAESETPTRRPASVEKLDFRQIETFEHPVYLREALETSRVRLMISSPWITGAVVTARFRDDLERAAKRGVLIHIGYGLGGDDEKSSDRAIKSLSALAARYPNVVIGYLAQTHAKVLLWDQNQITTSFNWLSFRGDRDKTYRHEHGNLIRNHASIDEFWEEHRVWIERRADKNASIKT